jgi:hypothetical protein
MKKYKIIKKTSSSGDVWYYLYERFLFFWWDYVTFSNDIENIREEVKRREIKQTNKQTIEYL